MKRTKNPLCFVALFCLVCLVWACGASAQGTGAVRYLKYNIHYQQHSHDSKASYANWTDPGRGHMILPVNTQVEFGTFRGGFSIITVPGRNEILFAYDDGHMRMGIPQYQELITSATPVALQSFSELDRKGISEGRAYVGMSKKGVMTALGYPATHRTPSPDSNAWVYWTNRMRTFTVQFDDKGIATAVGR